MRATTTDPHFLQKSSTADDDISRTSPHHLPLLRLSAEHLPPASVDVPANGQVQSTASVALPSTDELSQQWGVLEGEEQVRVGLGGHLQVFQRVDRRLVRWERQVGGKARGVVGGEHKSGQNPGEKEYSGGAFSPVFSLFSAALCNVHNG